MEAALAVPTVAVLLSAAARQLRAAGIDSARLDAEVLLAWALGADRAGLYRRLGDAAPEEALARFSTAIARRCRREPVAYLTGVQEFWSLPFAVTPAVLIPRPETELLVEIACRVARTAGAVRICDVGTGSGCIAVALARELPEAVITAVDLSAEALAVARANAAAHRVAERIAFAASDLLGALDAGASFDLIVSNPPYLAPGDALSPELAFEPQRALAAGDDGLDVVRRLLAAAPGRLRPGGWLLMECGGGQSDAVRTLAAAAGFGHSVVEADLAGIPRALVARRR